MFHHSRADLVSQPIDLLVPEVQRDAHRAAFKGFAAAPAVRPMGTGRPLKGRRRDGSEVHIDVSLGTVASEAGVLFMAVVRDCDDRHEADERLRDAEERFRLSFKQAPIGMALVELNGRFARVNESLCKTLGYSRDELTALTFQAVTHGEDVDLVRTITAKLARGEIRHYKLRKRYVRKDGGVVEARLTGSLVRDLDGKPLYFIAQIEDVTEENRASELLRFSERRYRELIEYAPDAILVTDGDDAVVDVNSAACAIYDFPRAELVGKRLSDLLVQSHDSSSREVAQLLRASDDARVFERNARRRDGSLVPVEVSAGRLTDGRSLLFSPRRHGTSPRGSGDSKQRSEAREATRRVELDRGPRSPPTDQQHRPACLHPRAHPAPTPAMGSRSRRVAPHSRSTARRSA